MILYWLGVEQAGVVEETLDSSHASDGLADCYLAEDFVTVLFFDLIQLGLLRGDQISKPLFQEAGELAGSETREPYSPNDISFHEW